MIARPASGPATDLPECICCGATLDAEAAEIGFCVPCGREMDRERLADQRRDEPDARAERILRMLEDT